MGVIIIPLMWWCTKITRQFSKPFTEPPLCRSSLLSLPNFKSIFAFFFLFMSFPQSIRRLCLSRYISLPEHRLPDISDILPFGAPTPSSSHATVFWLPLSHMVPVLYFNSKGVALFLLNHLPSPGSCQDCTLSALLFFSQIFLLPPQKKDLKPPSKSLSKLFY